jgi:polar amino acid transport system permease protein
LDILFDGINMQRILGGLWISARIALVSVTLSMVAGIFTGILMTKQSLILRVVCRFYLEAMRIIPVIVWLFIIYFGLSINFHLNLSGETASILVFVLWGAAEMGDLVRGSITSIDHHQYESGYALGLSQAQVYFFVIIPQAVRRLIPGAINLTTRMIKSTSLVVMIGVVEVLKIGQQVIEANRFQSPDAAFWVYGLIFLLYFILCMPLSRVSKYLERLWQ